MTSSDQILYLDESANESASYEFLAKELGSQSILLRSEPNVFFQSEGVFARLIIADIETLKRIGAKLSLKLLEFGSKTKVVCICHDWPSDEDIFFLSMLLNIDLILVEPLVSLAIREIRGIEASVAAAVETSFNRNKNNCFEIDELSPIQRKIAETVASLRLEATDEWRRLRLLLSECKANKGNRALKKNCLSLAHQLKGSLGSLGLSETSKNAAEIERALRIFQPKDIDEETVYWRLIEKLLDDGDKNLNQVDNPAGSSITFAVDENTPTVLVVGHTEDWNYLEQGLNQLGIRVKTAYALEQLCTLAEDEDITAVIVCSGLSKIPKFEICRYLHSQKPATPVFDYCSQTDSDSSPTETSGIRLLKKEGSAAETVRKILEN
ncbi:MAG: hypothetical protein DKT66_20715 [Candidatus Melainabacteria bacterium]|nr:MAG: hypothetical protein DKT66_20715 [Candidatus Melainabacteria bacterium]